MYKSGFKVNVLGNAINGALHKVEPIILDIKYSEYEKLQKKRKEAIDKGILIKSEDDFVNALISNSKKKIKAKIRLKGDLLDHLQSNKWSYRVKIRDEKKLFGMEKFSLQSPVTRNYIWELVFHELLRYEGLPSLRYFFRPLIINGDYRGIYAVEEHFDKILLESNGFKEAPIVKFSESLLWESEHEKGYDKTFSTGFKLNKISKNSILTRNFETANQLLNGLHSGEFRTSDVFDLNLLAKYFAIIDLVNANHASAWHNLRFYYDPFQSKLIPIGFDGEPNENLLEEISIERSGDLKLFEDNAFKELYLNNLLRISNKKYLDKFLKFNKEKFNRNKYILYKSFPALDTSTDNLYLNQLKIKSIIEPLKPINAFLENLSDNEISLNLANNQSLPIALKGIKINDNIFDINSKITLNGIKRNQKPIYENIKISIENLGVNQFEKSKTISLIYKIDGLSKTYESQINLFNRANPTGLKSYFKDKLDISRQPFLKINEKEKRIFIKKGEWTIKRPFIVPQGYTLIANAGVKIFLKDDGYILSYAPINFRGEKEIPIEINNFNKTPGNGFAL